MRRFLPLLGMLLLVGCGPTARIVPPVYTNSGSKGVMQITINRHHNRLGHPLVRVFPLYQPLQARNLSQDLKSTEPGKYTLTLPPLPPNKYRVVLELPYTIRFVGIPVGTATRRIITDFVIHPDLPASCFRFDNKQKDVMDWTSHGVYLDNRDKPVSKETCPGLFYTNSSWPYALNDGGHGGSLFVPVSNECFPKTSPQTSQQALWTFALVSPDLHARPDWQHLQAIRFHMATGSINVSVQPEIVYVLDNTRHSSLEDVQAASRYDVNSGHWNDYEYAFRLPHNATITHVIFHVYGVPEKTVSDKVDSIYLDAVCPVR